MIPLNIAVHAQGSGKNPWTVVSNIVGPTAGHGYCVGDSDVRWFVGWADAVHWQGDSYGALHPNQNAHQYIADQFLEELKKQGITGLPD